MLDTKYKAGESITEGDLHQAVSYAQAKGCQQAILIYPDAMGEPVRVGKVHVGFLPFKLDGDLKRAGHELVRRMMQFVRTGQHGYSPATVADHI